MRELCLKSTAAGVAGTWIGNYRDISCNQNCATYGDKVVGCMDTVLHQADISLRAIGRSTDVLDAVRQRAIASEMSSDAVSRIACRSACRQKSPNELLHIKVFDVLAFRLGTRGLKRSKRSRELQINRGAKCLEEFGALDHVEHAAGWPEKSALEGRPGRHRAVFRAQTVAKKQSRDPRTATGAETGFRQRAGVLEEYGDSACCSIFVLTSINSGFSIPDRCVAVSLCRRVAIAAGGTFGRP